MTIRTNLEEVLDKKKRQTQRAQKEVVVQTAK
jgi:hypothetical protein